MLRNPRTLTTKGVLENALGGIPTELFCHGPESGKITCKRCQDAKNMSMSDGLQMEIYENQTAVLVNINGTNYVSSVYLAFLCSILVEKEISENKKYSISASSLSLHQCGNRLIMLNRYPELSLLSELELTTGLCKKIVCGVLRIFEILEKFNYNHGLKRIDTFMFDKTANPCMYYFKDSHFTLDGETYIPLGSKDQTSIITCMDNFLPIFEDMFSCRNFSDVALGSKSIMNIREATKKGIISPEVIYTRLSKRDKRSFKRTF